MRPLGWLLPDGRHDGTRRPERGLDVVGGDAPFENEAQFVRVQLLQSRFEVSGFRSCLGKPDEQEARNHLGHSQRPFPHRPAGRRKSAPRRGDTPSAILVRRPDKRECQLAVLDGGQNLGARG